MDINVSVGDIKLTDPIDETFEGYDEDGGYGRRPVTLADLVADKVAQRIVAEKTGEYYNTIRARVDKQLDELVREQVKPLVDEAMAKPIRKTNTYGEPTGAETTLTELVIEAAHKWLEAPTGDSYNRDRRTMARKLVDEAVGAALTKELSAVIAAERAKVVAAVREQAADIIARSVAAGIGGK